MLHHWIDKIIGSFSNIYTKTLQVLDTPRFGKMKGPVFNHHGSSLSQCLRERLVHKLLILKTDMGLPSPLDDIPELVSK